MTALVGDAASVLALGSVALVLLFTLARYRSRVVQRQAFALFAAGSVVFAASLLLDRVGLPVAGREAVQVLAGTLYLAATWAFAAEFVGFDRDDPDPTPGDAALSAEGGGFDDVE